MSDSIGSRTSDVLADIELLVDSIAGLAAANRLTGLWDHVRFDECKKRDDDIDTSLVIRAERNARKNVELRAHFRRNIDLALKRLATSLR
jgi:hypothetical protein